VTRRRSKPSDGLTPASRYGWQRTVNPALNVHGSAVSNLKGDLADMRARPELLLPVDLELLDAIERDLARHADTESVGGVSISHENYGRLLRLTGRFLNPRVAAFFVEDQAEKRRLADKAERRRRGSVEAQARRKVAEAAVSVECVDERTGRWIAPTYYTGRSL